MGKSPFLYTKVSIRANRIHRPTSIQPANLKTEGGKSLENGHAAGEVDEATLRMGEVQYSTYFQQHGETLPPTAAGLASFH
jgi:pre-mRNA-processing factor 39